MLQRGSLVGGNTPVTVYRFLCWPQPAGLLPLLPLLPLKEIHAGITGRGSIEAPAGLGSAEAIRRPGSIEAPALSCRPGMLQRETLVGGNTPVIVYRFLRWPLPAGYAASYQ